MSVLFVAVVAIWLLVVSSPAATASCAAPSLTYSAGEVARGDTVRVAGASFGDSCYDTIPPGPPKGQGARGHPLRDIDILFVQGETEIVVAHGNADDEYSFSVDVVVPADLDDGEAWILARYDNHGTEMGTYEDSVEPVVVTAGTSAEPAAGSGQVETFGPGVEPTEVVTADASERSADPDSDSGSTAKQATSWALPAVAALGVVSGAGTLIWWRRARRAVTSP